MSNPLLNFLLDKKKKGLPMNIGQVMSELNIWREGKVESEVNTFRIHWEKNNPPIEPDFDWENEVNNAR